MANHRDVQEKPYKEVCTISTVNDLLYILELMEARLDTRAGLVNDRINLDANDYIIMRKGIEPIWEDPRNRDGGTFTIKMDHSKGYAVWSRFVMYMLGETLTDEMEYINGISVSYISDQGGYTYIKIWDAKPDRTREQFVNILPQNILSMIMNESVMYSKNSAKKDFNNTGIISKLKAIERNSYNRRSNRESFRRNDRNFI
jgi:hypothetical protein